MALDRHLVLVGLPGVGKTTVGRLVAQSLGCGFSDFDDEIADIFGKSVSKIFSEEGERSFREAEARVSQGWVGRPPAVLAPGGGWIANPDAVAHLRPSARIIYLRVAPAEALRRIGRGVESRPLLAGEDPEGILETLYGVRRNYYESLADVELDTMGLTAEDVAARVVAIASNTND